MPSPAASKEKQALDLLLSSINAWGTSRRVGLDNVQDGKPGDSLVIPAVGKVTLYVECVGVEAVVESMTVTTHSWRSRFSIWITAQDQGTVLEGRADLIDILLATEAGFSSIFTQPTWYDDFSLRPEIQVAGMFIGNQDIYFEYPT